MGADDVGLMGAAVGSMMGANANDVGLLQLRVGIVAWWGARWASPLDIGSAVVL